MVNKVDIIGFYNFLNCLILKGDKNDFSLAILCSDHQIFHWEYKPYLKIRLKRYTKVS